MSAIGILSLQHLTFTMNVFCFVFSKITKKIKEQRNMCETITLTYKTWETILLATQCTPATISVATKYRFSRTCSKYFN